MRRFKYVWDLRGVVNSMRSLIEYEEPCDGMYELRDVVYEFYHSDDRTKFPSPVGTYLDKEMDWFMSESPVLPKNLEYVKIWSSIAAEGTRSVNSNYGHKTLGQLRRINLEHIKGRRGVIMYADRDIINHAFDNIHAKNDVMCTLATCIRLRGNMLEYTIFQRSNDMTFGTIYNRAWHTHIGKILKKWLVSKGVYISDIRYTWHIGSLHVYARDKETFLRRYAAVSEQLSHTGRGRNGKALSNW